MGNLVKEMNLDMNEAEINKVVSDVKKGEEEEKSQGKEEKKKEEEDKKWLPLSLSTVNIVWANSLNITIPLKY